MDIQGFNVGKQFVAKALTVVASTGKVVDYFVLKPPVPLSTVTPRTVAQQRYEERNIHGIPWEAGEVPYAAASQQLLKSLGGCRCIVVKGHQKEAWLKEILLSEFKIINIEPFGPKMIKPKSNVCTPINNARAIQQWL